MPNASFTINGGALNTKASVSAAGAVVATLDSLSGVSTIEWSISGTDDTTLPADYTLTLSGVKNSVCTTTALTAGTAAILKCIINGGQNDDNSFNADYIKTVKFFVPTASGYEVGAYLESTESSSVYGATGILNAAIRGISASTSPTMGLPVRAASTANVANLAAASVSVDGVTLVAGDRYLLKDQSTASQNGVYVVGTVSGTAPLTRATDLNTSAEAVPGLTYYVQEGTANGEEFWTLTTPLPITLGSTSLTFENKVNLYAAAVPATPDTLLLRDGDGDGFLRDLDVRNLQPSGDIIYTSSNASPAITVLTPVGTGATAGVDLTIQAQQGQAVAAGTNNNGGDLILASGPVGTGGSAGDDGRVYTQIGATTAWDLRNTSGVLQQVVDSSWSRYDINKANGGIRLAVQTGGNNLDLSSDVVQFNTTGNSVMGYFYSAGTEFDWVANNVPYKMRIPQTGGTGTQTAKNVEISAQPGRAVAAGTNNDGGDIILTAGAVGTGGSNGVQGSFILRHGESGGATYTFAEESTNDVSITIDPTSSGDYVRITSTTMSDGKVVELRAAASQNGGEVNGHGIARVIGAVGNTHEVDGGKAFVQGGDGYATGTGGAGGSARVVGGAAAGSAANAGGGVILTGGAPTAAGAGGGITGTAAAGVTNGNGGSISFTSGAGNGTGDGGGFTVLGGAGGASSGNGGNLSLTAGAGNTAGNVDLIAGAGVAATGGNARLLAGDGGTNSAGGTVDVTSGAGSGSGAGGALTVTSGTAGNSGSANGGLLSLVAGDSGGAGGNGGGIAITAGEGNGTSGGAIAITAGNGAGASSAGGDITVSGGGSDGTGQAGTIELNPGAGAGANTAGGDLVIRLGGGTGTGDAGDFEVISGSAPGDGRVSNITLFSASPDYNGAANVIFLADCDTAPSATAVTGGIVLFSQGGVLKYVGAAGTIVSL